MSPSGIPRTFWDSVSVAVLAFTVILCYAAIRATSISIRYKDAQIDLLRVDEQKEKLAESVEAVKASTDVVTAAAEQVESERESLASQKRELNDAIQEIERKAPSAITPELRGELQRVTAVEPQPDKPIVDRRQLDEVRRRLDSTERFLLRDGAPTER